MAQTFVGVNGAKRAISEIYVGVGGARRTVTEVYVGVNGVPRLAWSGNKWANRLYLAVWNYFMRTGVQSFYVYSLDPSTFAAYLVSSVRNSTELVSYQWREPLNGLGANIGAFTRSSIIGQNFYTYDTDIDTLAITKMRHSEFIEDNFRPAPFGAKLDYFQGYLYGNPGNQSDGRFLGRFDFNTTALIKTVWCTAAARNIAANASSLYFGSTSLYQIADYDSVAMSYLFDATYLCNLTATENSVFTTSQSQNSYNIARQNIPTGAVLSTGTSPTNPDTGWNANNLGLFSPKKK